MKIKTLVLMLIVAIMSLNCKNDDDTSKAVDLQGTWNLVNISGGIGGTNHDFPEGEITWSFDNSTLLVVNNNPVDNVSFYSGLETGSYSYNIANANGNEYLVVEGSEQGQIIETGNTMSLNQNEYTHGSGNDGFAIQFER